MGLADGIQDRGWNAEGASEDRTGEDVGSTYEMELPARELVEALRLLSPRQRAAVVLHHAAGYPVREVAAILGSTPSAVKVHLKRGRDRLRKSLSEDQ